MLAGLVMALTVGGGDVPGLAGVGGMKKLWKRLRPVLPHEVAIPVQVGLWWRRNRVWKRIRGKPVDPPKAVEKTSEQLEYEVTEARGMALRTSTGAGLAGVAVNLLMQVLQAFPQTAELATPEVAAGLTAVVMWAVARIWKTPEKPGAL